MSDTWSADSNNDHAIDHLYIAFKLYYFLEEKGLIDKYRNLYWKLFLSFELFSINNSKTKERKKLIKNEAKTFINSHADSFNKIPSSVKDEIRQVNSKHSIINKAKIKKVAVKFMPTYRLQVSNIERLKRLKNSETQLNNTINKYL